MAGSAFPCLFGRQADFLIDAWGGFLPLFPGSILKAPGHRRLGRWQGVG